MRAHWGGRWRFCHKTAVSDQRLAATARCFSWSQEHKTIAKVRQSGFQTHKINAGLKTNK